MPREKRDELKGLRRLLVAALSCTNHIALWKGTNVEPRLGVTHLLQYCTSVTSGAYLHGLYSVSAYETGFTFSLHVLFMRGASSLLVRAVSGMIE